jgi:XTP/dITP diphosphohydrolase
MKEIVIATENMGKLHEIEESLRETGIRIVSLRDFPSLPPIEEDGMSFRENALKKARIVVCYTGMVTVADDSGLEVDVLDGAPGVHSARFAGEGASDADNNNKLLKLLEDVPLSQRGASFRCVLAVIDPRGKEIVVEGECRGAIGHEERGRNGFGYDPIFLLPERGETLAELPTEEKNKISHRGKALASLKEVLRGFY